MTKKMKTYTELIQLPTFEERLAYLQLHGRVGRETFGYDRYLNQYLYQQCPEWKAVRKRVILRDGCCDLGDPDHEIFPYKNLVKVYVHHMNPITKEDILNRSELVLNPEYLITTTKATHDIIHYGYKNSPRPNLTERTPYDTCPWRKGQT